MTTESHPGLVPGVTTSTPDVLVVGAGSAGVAAATAAAEEGASTLLLESATDIGGTLAWQLLEHSAGFHDQHGAEVVGGIGRRLVTSLRENGATPGYVPDQTGYTKTRVPVDHASVPLIEAEMLAGAGVQLWLESRAVAAERNHGISSVHVQTPAGARLVQPTVVVDCSGDAFLAHAAGARFHDDAAGRIQPASILFKLANVDFVELLDYARTHPTDLRPGSVIGTATADVVNLWGYGNLLAEAHHDGRLSFARSEMHLAGWPRRRELIVNLTRTRMSGSDGASRGSAYLTLSKQILEAVGWFRRSMPGCSECYLAAIGNRVGIRESRRLRGHTTLSADDLHTGRRFADVVARGAFPMDVHDQLRPGLSHAEPIPSAFDIPYGSLHGPEVENLLVAGRIVSSSHAANGSIRITGTCFATGEAAGTAAAIAADATCPVKDIDVSDLQNTLRKRGAILE